MIWKNILGIKCLVSDMEIFSKRKQLKKFSERAPSKELVQTILRKTFELTPSKQNMMPYNVHVLDHTHTKEKDTLYELSTFSNCYHNHQLKAPYVLLFQPRTVEETEHMKSELFKSKGGYLNVLASDVAVEIGMFVTIFTGLCLEYDIPICLDIAHLILSANYYNENWKKWYELLLPICRHIHLSDAEGDDGEGVTFGKGDLHSKDEILDLDYIKVLEIWEGHHNSGQGFKEGLRYLSNQ